jgi:hypothetical protein
MIISDFIQAQHLCCLSYCNRDCQVQVHVLVTLSLYTTSRVTMLEIKIETLGNHEDASIFFYVISL